MSMSISMDGLAGLQADLRRASAEARARVDDAVVGSAMELRGDVVKRIQRGPATGAVYEKYEPRRTHQSSSGKAPAEAPASDQGGLVRSVLFDKVGQMSATVGSDLVYAAVLEFGSDRIDPRPAWVPAVELMTPKFVSRVERALEEAFR